MHTHTHTVRQQFGWRGNCEGQTENRAKPITGLTKEQVWQSLSENNREREWKMFEMGGIEKSRDGKRQMERERWRERKTELMRD